MPLFKINDIDIMAEDKGDAGDVPLILVRGLGTQMINWHDSFLDALRGHGLRPIIFDNRDVGETQKFGEHGKIDLVGLIAAKKTGQTPKLPYTISDMAADVIGVMDAFDIEQAHIMGISMGGVIVQRCALDHRERLLSMTSIMSTSGSPDVPRPSAEVQAHLLSGVSDPNDRDAVLANSLKGDLMWASPGYPIPEEERLAGIGRAYDRCYYPEGIGRQYAAMIASMGEPERLAEITTPTLVIHGSDDTLIDVECGRDTARRIDGAELHEIPGMGHEIPPGLSQTIADLMGSFIDRVK